MIKTSMGEAKVIVVAALVLAIILFAPPTRGAMDGSATPPLTIGSLAPGEEKTFIFESVDALGATRYTAIRVTLTTGNALAILLTRAPNPPAAYSINVQGNSVLIGLDTTKPYTYSLNLRSPTGAGAAVVYSHQLQGAVLPALFSVVPGFSLAL